MTNRHTQTTAHNPNRGELMTMYVEVTTELDMDELYPEDRDALGYTYIRVPSDLPPHSAAAATLGAFHATVGIKRTWDFDFKVFDDDGEEVEPTYEFDICKLAEAVGAYVLMKYPPL